MVTAFLQKDLLDEGVAAPLTMISGLTYIPEYIDKALADGFVKVIDSQPWMTDLKRRVQHYGYSYDYKARNVTAESRLGILPDWILPLCNKLCSERIFSEKPDQLIVNEYLPGQGIASHIDCVSCFGEPIVSLSLGSGCVMDFTHSKTQEKTSRLLEGQSLLVMSKDARYVWRHGIAQRKTDRWNGALSQRGRRISLTFRNVVLS